MTSVATKYGFDLAVTPTSYFTQFLMQTKCWEEPESELILSLLKPGDIAVDAGSYIGYFACLMAKAGAKVIAIEPNPNLFEILCSNIAGLDVQVVQAALTDQAGEAQFYLSSDYDDGWASLAAAVNGDRSRPINVVTRRLDGLLPPGRIKLIKLDVEGAEIFALRGLGDRIEDVDYLLIECIDLPYRVAVLDSTTDAVNKLLAGWRIYEPRPEGWTEVPAAYSTVTSSQNFLFCNPKYLAPYPFLRKAD